ncbi:hypothetical protein UN63_04630 [Oceanisphaera arctica]|uniref:Integral membrane protein n=1 Tax=Oceanisphaera arctica TaxID=641510 RepID=A0A2P5TPL1_9GAMM|nr:hypothetical protein UN63_04630 [Oceanisphaera arctica]
MENNTLTFRFPEIHEDAKLRIDFKRTLRVPDDGNEYPLPAGVGQFSLRHIEDFRLKLPETWLQRGGVMMPMYQSEAMWINFSGHYPMAIKIAAGKINAVTGEPWKNTLNTEPQDYVTTPVQPWLDGFSTGEDQVNQFVASRLGDGQSAEEQLTGEAEFGGLQLIVYPLKAEIYEQELAERAKREQQLSELDYLDIPVFLRKAPEAMGLGLGGKIRQTIYEDERGIDAWIESPSRCFVHIINSEQWRDITGHPVPHPPVTRKQYKQASIPWFDYYDDEAKALPGSTILSKLKTFSQFQKPGSKANNSIAVSKVIPIRRDNRVNEGDF